jgi:phosphatidylserine/phosphatidylglycerophosphate/cardiolipin synthase-like enzyme
MPNITGTLTEQGAGPLVGYRVELWRIDENAGSYPDDHTVTDAAGHYVFSVLIGGLIITGGVNTFQIRVKSIVGRLVFKTALFNVDVLSGTQDFSATIPSANLRGLLVTNLSSTGTAALLSQNNLVTPFIDNASAWFAIQDAASRATTEIDLLLFYFDIGLVFFFFTPDPPTIGTPTQGIRLENLLLQNNAKTPPIAIRLAIRRAVPFSYPVSTADPVQAFFQQHTPNTISVRVIATDARVPMHAKCMAIDNIGFLIGSPFLQEYFDATTHFIDEPRRGPMSSFPGDGLLGGQSKNTIRGPVHDVSLQIQGPAVGDLRSTFFLEWNAVGPTDGTAGPVPPVSNPNTSLQLVRSLPGNTFPGLPDGEAGILEAYLRVFEQANTFVYLENQYLTEPAIFEGIRLSLLAAKARGSALQFIILLNTRLDIPTYNNLQKSQINQLKSALKADGTDSRLGLFTIWSMDQTQPKPRIVHTYIHSKVAIVDDLWATIGSANLDGASMMTSQGLMPPLSPADENQRNSEVNAVMFNGVAGQPASNVPVSLRQQLWAEHLGLSPMDPQLVTAPAGGWLALWTQVATNALNGLKAPSPTVGQARILPWTDQTESIAFLTALGVDQRKVTILKEVRSFNFNTGQFVG